METGHRSWAESSECTHVKLFHVKLFCLAGEKFLPSTLLGEFI